METLKRTEQTFPNDDREGHKKQVGFWMPVGGSPFPGENRPEPGVFDVWMEWDPDYQRFLGTVKLGQLVHVEAYRVVQRRSDGEWHVDADDETDVFVASKVDGNWPCQTFQVEGFEGEWICVVDPFT